MEGSLTRIRRVFDPGSSCHVVAGDVRTKIHIFRGLKRQSIVRCDKPPSAIELLRSQTGEWQLLAASADGTVYRKCLSSLDAINTDANVNVEQMDIENADSNQSIFDELLTESEKAKSAYQFFDLPERKLIQEEPIFELTEEDKILFCGEEVLAICCAEDVTAVVCTDSTEVLTVLLYSLKETKLGGDRTCEESAYKLSLPSCHGILGVRTKPGKGCVPTLHFVTCSERVNVSQSSSQLVLPPHLFSLLFGWEPVAQALPILLCTFLSGDVHYHHVNLSASSSSSCVQWNQLCAINSPIVDIFCLKITRTLTENEALSVELQMGLPTSMKTPSHSALDCIMFVGASGQCCMMVAIPAIGSEKADFRLVTVMFALSSPVACACIVEGALFASTGRSVVKHMLTLHTERLDGQQKQFKVQVKSEQLRCACITDMWISDKANTLVCQTASGDLILLDTTTPSPTDNSPSSSIKDLLVSINVNQLRLEEMKLEHQQLNSLIQQMNIASRLLHQSSLSSFGQQETAPVVCSVVLKSDVGYCAVDYFVVVTVTNKSRVALSKHWGFSVFVEEVGCCSVSSSSTSARNMQRNSVCSSRTVPDANTSSSSRGAVLENGRNTGYSTEREMLTKPGESNTQRNDMHSSRTVPETKTNSSSRGATFENHKRTGYSTVSETLTKPGDPSPDSNPSSHTLELFRGLKPGQSATIKIPVAYSPSLIHYDVKVRMFLHPSEVVREQITDGDSDADLDISLTSVFLDAFHFLHLHQPDEDFPFCERACQSDEDFPFAENLAKGFPVGADFEKMKGGQQGKKEEYGKQTEQSYTVTVKVPPAHKFASQKPEELLCALLTGSQVNSSALTATHSCNLHDVSANFLTLSVERNEEGCVSGGGGDADGGRGMSVVIMSPSLLLLAKLRLAVLYRLGEHNTKQKETLQVECQETMKKILSLQQVILKTHQQSPWDNQASASSDVLNKLSVIHETLAFIAL